MSSDDPKDNNELYGMADPLAGMSIKERTENLYSKMNRTMRRAVESQVRKGYSLEEAVADVWASI
jgi:hypothetical protein